MDCVSLSKKIIENELISSFSDLKFCFSNFPKLAIDISINQLIEEAICWAYQNDELEVFYLEHLTALGDLQIIEPIISCTISNPMGAPASFIDLFVFESKNKLYFKVEDNTDLLDTSCWYRTTPKSLLKETIEDFKLECEDAFTCNGDFDYNEIIQEGHSICFYPNS